MRKNFILPMQIVANVMTLYLFYLNLKYIMKKKQNILLVDVMFVIQKLFQNIELKMSIKSLGVFNGFIQYLNLLI